MSASPHEGAGGPERLMPSFWLPPNTRGNGLSAASWAEIAVVTEQETEPLLDALCAAGVPARVSTGPQTHLYVAPERYAQAENVLLRERRGDTAPATWREVKQLWWFCDGAIMDTDTRDHLWQARGPCERHSWLYLCAECELKYQPLGAAVLYEDLVGRMHTALAHRHTQLTRNRMLSRHESCFTCDYIATPANGPASFAAEVRQVRAAERTRAWLDGSHAVWRARVCPMCAGQTPGAQSMLCREHLIESGDHTEVARLLDYLRQLRPRLRTCVSSMTFQGPPHTPDSDGALVEAVGWFAGWRPALRCVSRR